MNIGKFIAFYFCWGVSISIPFILWKNPKLFEHNAALLRLYLELVPLVMTILVTIIFIKIIEKNKNIKINIFKNITTNTILGLSGGILWIGIALLIGFGAGIFHIKKVIEVTNISIWIIAIFLNTVMQELLVRGYIFSLLIREYNLPVAIGITTAVFTFLHGGAFEAGFLPVLNVLTSSILFSLVLIRSKGLWVPILMHFIWNSVGRIFGIVSLANDYPVIFETTTKGNNLISGGSVGFEGSIIVFAINCVFIIVLFSYTNFKSIKAGT